MANNILHSKNCSFTKIVFMKKILFVSFCFLLNTFLFGQQKNYINPTEEQKTEFTLAIDTLLNNYFNLSDFKNENGAFELQRKKEFKAIFDDKVYVVDDLSLASYENILLSDYADNVSLKFLEIKEQLMQFPYKREILFDSILFDAYKGKYEIPLKLHKKTFFGIDAQNKIVEKERSLNLLLYINYYTKSKNIKIAGIEQYNGTITWLDCNGEKEGAAYVFSPCENNDENTINGTYQIDCSCVGVDCLGVLNGASKIGTPCDDGDDNTINDTYETNCDCIGTDACIVDTNCDDGNESTVNDVYLKDCTCLGNCEIDGKPITIGGLCNDDNENTYDDTYQEDCSCVGVDCIGEINGSKIIGTACDDGNDNTVMDVYVNNCFCEGVPGCTINGREIEIGKPCNDYLDYTTNDTYQNDCSCKGENCLGEVGGPALKGTTCNDGNPNTTNDKYTADCVCVGNYKALSIYTGIGGLGFVPLGNISQSAGNSQLNFSQAIAYGGKINVLLNPKSSKFYITAGLNYLPLKIETSGIHHLQFNNTGVENFEVPVDILFVNLNNFKETASSNFIQIPIGISYNLFKQKNIKVLLDVLAKPYLQISKTAYSLKTNVQYAARFEKFGLFKAEDFIIPCNSLEEGFNPLNETIEEYGYAENFVFESDGVEDELKLDLPFAVAGGFNIMFDIGNFNTSFTSSIGLHVHYNYYFKNITWQSTNNETGSDIEEFLKTGNIKDINNEYNINNPNNTNFKSTISGGFSTNEFIRQGIEAGLSYHIKIK